MDGVEFQEYLLLDDILVLLILIQVVPRYILMVHYREVFGWEMFDGLHSIIIIQAMRLVLIVLLQFGMMLLSRVM